MPQGWTELSVIGAQKPIYLKTAHICEIDTNEIGETRVYRLNTVCAYAVVQTPSEVLARIASAERESGWGP